MENELYGPCLYCGGTGGHEATCPRIVQRTAIEMMECVSLRDWFAGQALAGYCFAVNGDTPEDRAENAYMIADAMLRERAKSTEVKHAD